MVIKGLSMFPLERQFSQGIWFFFLSFLGIKESGQSVLIVHARPVLRSLCEFNVPLQYTVMNWDFQSNSSLCYWPK